MTMKPLVSSLIFPCDVIFSDHDHSLGQFILLMLSFLLINSPWARSANLVLIVLYMCYNLGKLCNLTGLYHYITC